MRPSAATYEDTDVELFSMRITVEQAVSKLCSEPESNWLVQRHTSPKLPPDATGNIRQIRVSEIEIISAVARAANLLFRATPFQLSLRETSQQCGKGCSLDGRLRLSFFCAKSSAASNYEVCVRPRKGCRFRCVYATIDIAPR